MKYVKLTARPNTWFKERTEVFNYDANFEDQVRLTVEEFEEWNKSGIICVRGIRVCEDIPNENGLGCSAGEERIDGESCGIDEFDVEYL